jgi:hypothetical protein
VACEKRFETKTVQLPVVFAATLYLDIHNILRDKVDRCFGDLEYTANFICNDIKETLELHENMRISNWPKQNDDAVAKFVGCIKEEILDDPHRQYAIRVGRYRIPEPFLFYRRHPWLCGLWKYRIRIEFHKISVIFVNAWGSIMACTHLYNAVQREKMLELQWRDMDFIIGLQGSRTFFVGEAPNNPEDYEKRFALALGISAANFAAKSDRKKKGIIQSKRPAGLETTRPGVPDLCREVQQPEGPLMSSYRGY